jgi:hypothetical protein
VWRVNCQAPSQRVLLRRGAIGQIRRGRLAFVAEVRSLAHVLGRQERWGGPFRAGVIVLLIHISFRLQIIHAV